MAMKSLELDNDTVRQAGAMLGAEAIEGLRQANVLDAKRAGDAISGIRADTARRREDSGRFAGNGNDVQQQRQPGAEPVEPKDAADKPAPKPDAIEGLRAEIKRLADAEAKRQAGEVQKQQSQPKPAQETQEQQRQAEPGFYDDPEGFTRRTIERTTQEAREYVARQRQQEEAAALLKHASEDEESFRKKAPDYDQAADHLMRSLDAELAYNHPNSTPEQRMTRLRADYAKLIDGKRKEGKSAAEALYGLAKVRGYQPPAGRQNADPNVFENPTGRADATNEGEAMRRRGQERAIGLAGSKGAGSERAGVRVNDIARMSDAEIERQIAQGGRDFSRFVFGRQGGPRED